MSQENSDLHQDMGMAEEKKLKYLQFVQVAAIHSAMCFSSLYSQGKEKSGLLKPSVETIEGTVKNVVGPVYEKYHDVPIEVLKFVDTQVDKSVTKLERRVPPVVKQVSAKALSGARKVPEVAREVASEVKRSGVVDTASGMAKSVYSIYETAAKELYSKYEPVAEQRAVSAWHKMNKLPLVAQMVVPTAAYCSEKYNESVVRTAEKGFRVSAYLPLVPTEKIAKVFGNEMADVNSE